MHILCLATISRKSWYLWDNVENVCRAGQDTVHNMTHVQFALDIHGYKHTLGAYNIYCFSEATIVASTWITKLEEPVTGCSIPSPLPLFPQCSRRSVQSGARTIIHFSKDVVFSFTCYFLFPVTKYSTVVNLTEVKQKLFPRQITLHHVRRTLIAVPQGQKKWPRIWFISFLKGQIVRERQGEGQFDGDDGASERETTTEINVRGNWTETCVAGCGNKRRCRLRLMGSVVPLGSL